MRGAKLIRLCHSRRVERHEDSSFLCNTPYVRLKHDQQGNTSPGRFHKAQSHLRDNDMQ